MATVATGGGGGGGGGSVEATASVAGTTTIVGAAVVLVVVAAVVVVVVVVVVVAAVVVVVVLLGSVLFTFSTNCSTPLRFTIWTVLPTFWPSMAAESEVAGTARTTVAAVGAICCCLTPLCVNAAFVLRNHSVGLGRHSAETRNGMSTAPMMTVHTKIKPR